MLKFGHIYRYAREKDHRPGTVDGLANYFSVTYSEGYNLPLLDSGINPIGSVNPRGRRPAVLIRSSPHKIGSLETPWQDFFDPDNGHIHYFGDAKKQGEDPSVVRGNKVLLEEYELHNSFDSEMRQRSAPIIFFKSVKVGNRIKGNVRFLGYGIISCASRTTQFHPRSGEYFTNYVFDFSVFSMANENEMFDWSWITARRDEDLSIEETLEHAPVFWKEWIKHGPSVVAKCKRRASKLILQNKTDQLPENKTREERALRDIYNFYSAPRNRKERFEGLASLIASKVIDESGRNYTIGWVTPKKADRGIDFVGRLDVGTEFSRAKLVVLGQAKCISPKTRTTASDISRTVARLKRGWIGVFVTTSYYSQPAQIEVIEDKYPLIMINGKRLAKEVLKICYFRGHKTVKALLKEVDQGYDSMIMDRNPEEILLD